MKKIVIAGRPNTGKSTLFNALTGTRDALVHDRPGVTRDCITGMTKDEKYMVCDTAGLEKAKAGVGAMATDMSLRAIAAADAILFVVDGRAGLLPEDLEWARTVKKAEGKGQNAKVLLLVNKSESLKRLSDVSDFYKLGFGEPVMISAEHKTGFEKIYEFLSGLGDES